jgi:hypothetical protein
MRALVNHETGKCGKTTRFEAGKLQHDVGTTSWQGFIFGCARDLFINMTEVDEEFCGRITLPNLFGHRAPANAPALV